METLKPKEHKKETSIHIYLIPVYILIFLMVLAGILMFTLNK